MRKDFGLADVFGASFTQPEPVEIPDLYLRLASGGELIPQDPQVLRFKVNDGTVLAETIDRGHRQNLGPAIVKRRFGAGNALYIGSSLEAVYEETRMKSLRAFFDSLLYQPGVMAHFMASKDALVLHLLADTGNKNKHLRSREEFVPVTDVKVRIGVPRAVRQGSQTGPKMTG